MLLHELVTDWETREKLGNLIIVITSFILIANLSFILVTSVKPFVRQQKLKKIRK